MDKVGKFFIKLGQSIKKGFFALITWVKETAWVQPLLIVAVIFAFILSINPVIKWVSGLFNPDETYDFYVSNTVSDMTKLEADYIDKNGENATVVVIFYGNSDSSSKDLEKIVKNFTKSSSYQKSVVWYCIDADDDNTDTVKHEENQQIINDAFQYTFLDDYNSIYKDMPSSLKSSSADDLTFCDDDTTNTKIPTPLLARYNYIDGSQKVDGIHVGSINTDDLQLFVEGTKEEWENPSLFDR